MTNTSQVGFPTVGAAWDTTSTKPPTGGRVLHDTPSGGGVRNDGLIVWGGMARNGACVSCEGPGVRSGTSAGEAVLAVGGPRSKS